MSDFETNTQQKHKSYVLGQTGAGKQSCTLSSSGVDAVEICTYKHCRPRSLLEGKSDQGLHSLLFYMHVLEALLHGITYKFEL